MIRPLPLVLAVVVVAVLALGGRAASRGVVLVRGEHPVLVGGRPHASPDVPSALDTPVDRDRLAHATPDDLARGILALASLPASDPRALTADQRARLLESARSGAAARTRRDELRTEARRAERAWLASGAVLWESLPRDTRAALLPRASRAVGVSSDGPAPTVQGAEGARPLRNASPVAPSFAPSPAGAPP